MSKNKHKLLAQSLHKNKFNCAQAFICSYANELDIDEEKLLRLSEGLGQGIAGLEDTCCIPVLIAMLIPYLEGKHKQINPSRLESYACAKCLIMDFKEKVGSIKCKDILEKNKKRCCTDIIQIGVDIMDECIQDD